MPDPVILRGGHIIVQIAQPFAVVERDHTTDDNVAGAMRGQVIGGIGLEPFAQRLGHGIAQPGLQRLIVERQNLDRFFTGHGAVDRTEMVAGAPGEQRHRDEGKKFPQAHFQLAADTCRCGLSASMRWRAAAA